MNRKKWDRIEILWLDSYRTHGWLALEDAHVENDSCLDHRTIGYYLGETTRQISVCQSSKTAEELIDQPETQIDAVMNIPKNAITQVIDLLARGPKATNKANSNAPKRD